LGGYLEGIDSYIIGDSLLEDKKLFMVYVVKDEKKLRSVSKLFSEMYPEISYINIPAWDCLPYDNASPSTNIIGERIKSFIKLLDNKNKPRIIFVTVNALIQKNIPIDFFSKYKIEIKLTDNLNINSFLKNINILGYKRVSTVMEIGEYSLRGGIIDIFSPNYDHPLRIDLFGDDVDSIKFFDVLTQISKKKIDNIVIIPTSEIIMNDKNINNFKDKYKMLFGINSINDEVFQLVKEKQKINGIEHWISLFYEKLLSLFEILDNKYIFLLDHNFEEISQSRIDDIKDYHTSRNINYNEAKKNKNTINFYKPINSSDLYCDSEHLKLSLSRETTISLSLLKLNNPNQNLKSQKIRNFSLERQSSKIDFIDEFINYIKKKVKQKNKVIIACKSLKSRKNIYDLLNKNNIFNIDTKTNYFSNSSKNITSISLMILNLEVGFIINNLIVISESDIFGKINKKKSNQKKQINIALEEADSFELGDYLVHQDYGVGIYNGLKTIKINKIAQDCIEIGYLHNDKLLLPVQNIDLVSKFSGKSSEVTLDKLGSKNWISKKLKVKEKIRDMAEKLIRTATDRKLGKAKKLYCSNNEYENFASKFPFYETKDQIDVINDVIKDIKSEKPMDRLICGDVGFGKTEVAMRAAFIAAKSKTQVAIITPTTLLARQHYETFLERFKNQNINIVQLSRLISYKEQKKVVSEIKTGFADIVIGTHALLSNKVKFNNLSLFIVDEEQRFGVNQKETLKNFISNVHVLTLTATPIPRTLHMSLAGIKELSIIATAPEERIPVRTFVVHNNDFNIKEGINRELNRGGQVFCIVPRIKDLNKIKDKLVGLIGNVSLSIIHGRMSSNEIEKTMIAFYEGNIKILLSTTIIENGLDIPNANTIFIFNADMFGLSQLYQLKGRVGRSNKRAYAYYLLDKKFLTSNAEKRIHAIQSLEGLGAGFSLASHDLDIRGAGNLLGEEQSGQIKEVGLSLYQKLLEEAVNDIKGLNTNRYDWTPQINIQAPALIPEFYILDLSLRLQLYRRLSNLVTLEDFEKFKYELVDRFGLIPKEVIYLLNVMKIKQNCLIVGISRIDSGINGAVIEFIDKAYMDPNKYIDWLDKNKSYLKMKNDQKLIISVKWKSIEERLNKIELITFQLTKFTI